MQNKLDRCPLDNKKPYTAHKAFYDFDQSNSQLNQNVGIESYIVCGGNQVSLFCYGRKLVVKNTLEVSQDEEFCNAVNCGRKIAYNICLEVKLIKHFWSNFTHCFL